MSYDRQFSDLEAAIDGVQAHLEEQIETSSNGSVDALCRLRLSVHEWMANLMRHAEFAERSPEIRVRVWRDDKRLHCAIRDNSEGFDLSKQLWDQIQARASEGLPEGGMGLLLLQSSTDHAEYEPIAEQENRLELVFDYDSRTHGE